MGFGKAWRQGILRALATVTLAGGCAGAGAQTAGAPDTSIGGALRNLASRAQDVFVGQVAAINRKGGTVEVQFRVDQTVAGAAGGVYTLREWAGLWPPGQHRYFVGQRALVFMHKAGAAGLSTPVDGAEGLVPVMVQGVGAAPLLDVRRLSARVQRSTTAPLDGVETGAIALSDATGIVANWRKPVFREPVRRPLPVGYRPAPPPVGYRPVAPGGGPAASPEPGPGLKQGGPGREQQVRLQASPLGGLEQDAVRVPAGGSYVR